MAFVTNGPLLCTNNTGCILFNSAFFATVILRLAKMASLSNRLLDWIKMMNDER
jgi:hypothetical protein